MPQVPSMPTATSEVSAITPALREHYGAPPGAGVLVVRVDPQGLGGRSGIRVGDAGRQQPETVGAVTDADTVRHACLGVGRADENQAGDGSALEVHAVLELPRGGGLRRCRPANRWPPRNQ